VCKAEIGGSPVLPGLSIARVAFLSCPNFQKTATKGGLLDLHPSIRMGYRTDEQFLNGLRTVLHLSADIETGSMIYIYGEYLDIRPRCPVDKSQAGDILCQFGWIVQGFDIQHTEHFFLNTNQLAFEDVSMRVIDDFQRAL